MFRPLLLVIYMLLLPLPLQASNEQINIIVAADMPEINSNKGSYPELATLLKQVRQHQQPTFFIFGGGSIGPSAMSAFDRGTHIIDILNMLEPDAMAITKREFSYFEDELSLRAYEAAFPFVASNLSFAGEFEKFGGLQSQVLIEKQGIKLGVISVIDSSVITEYRLDKVRVYEPLKAIELNAAQLRQQGADAIILLYSQAYTFVSELLNNHVIDAAILTDQQIKSVPSIVANHPNNFYLNQEGTAVEVNLHWVTNKEQPPNISWKKHQLLDYPADAKVTKHSQQYLNRLSRLLDEKIGTFKTSADSRTSVVRSKESSFANFITDSLKDFFKADIAMINGGAIRGDRLYQANESITRRNITTELPFRAHIVMLEVSGAVFKQAIENGLSQIENRKGRFLHFSGAQVEFDSSKPAFQRLKKVVVDGKPLRNDAVYTLVTTDYLASGGDGFSMLIDLPQQALNTRSSPLLLDVIVNAIRTERAISPKLDGRLLDFNKDSQ